MPRTPTIQEALKRDRTVDITTLGRKTGRPRRIEIWFHNLDDRIYLTGTPGPRDWYANLRANPTFAFHLKRTVREDIPARARPIREAAERRHVLSRILGRLGDRNLEIWVRGAPLVEVLLDLEGGEAAGGDRPNALFPPSP